MLVGQRVGFGECLFVVTLKGEIAMAQRPAKTSAELKALIKDGLQ
jgi:hypothetical protein